MSIFSRQTDDPYAAEKNAVPFGTASLLYINQNFREFSLMPGPMVLEITAERI